MRIFAALFLFPLLAAGQSEAQNDWRFAHPDATLVGSLRPRAVLDSPLFASAWNSVSSIDPAAAAMVGMAKSRLSGIREIRFSLLDNGTPEPDVVALIDGIFDEAALGILGQANGKYRRIDANTILFGNGASLDRAAARLTQTTPVLQPRVLAGTAALGSYDLWISGRVPNLPEGGLNLPDGIKLDVRALSFGLSLRESIEMELTVYTASPAAAEALLKTAHEAEAMQPAPFRGLLQSFADGARAHFRMSVPSEVVMDALRMRATPALSASNAPQPLPVAPAPRRATIVIQGLDGGPREIPIQ